MQALPSFVKTYAGESKNFCVLSILVCPVHPDNVRFRRKIPKKFDWSALYSSRAVAAHELFDIANAHAVKVTNHAVLEAACRNCEFERQLLVLILVQPVDQAARKRIAAADPVDDVPNFVLFRHVKVLAVV